MSITLQNNAGHPIERHIVLVAPEIHWNTGNIGRTCVATGSYLHLIQPLGFSIDSREVQRAGLDYWDNVSLKLWEDFNGFTAQMKPQKDEVAVFSKRGKNPFWSMPPSDRLFLIFGSETKGLPAAILNQFADATSDHQWIHLDKERAEKESPYGTTIAHGYLNLSILPYLWKQIVEINNIKMLVNYGIEKLKFNQPVLVNSEVRVRAKLNSATNLKGIIKAEFDVILEIKGNNKSALDASLIFLYHFN